MGGTGGARRRIIGMSCEKLGEKVVGMKGREGGGHGVAFV